jgi:hypothetical protein
LTRWRVSIGCPPHHLENVMSYIEDKLSYRAQIEELAPGESFARACRFDGDEVTKTGLQEASRGLRLATQPTVHRITKRTGQQYTIECGDFRTLSRDVVLCLVVTRLA